MHSVSTSYWLEHCFSYKSVRERRFPVQLRKDSNMNRFAASALLVFALVTVAASQRQLPCNSQLRLHPSFQHLFTHCDPPVTDPPSCQYGEWSEWSVEHDVQVPTSQCSSGKAVNETRRQTDSNGVCDDNVESRQNCKSRSAFSTTVTILRALMRTK